MPTPNTQVQTVGDWQWQVWELHPKTGRPCKWIGQFFDHKGAFAWIDKQPRGREGYRVNNIPPTMKSTKPLGSTSVTATSPTRTETREDVADFPVRVRQFGPTEAEKQARYDRIKAGEFEKTKPSARRKPARTAAKQTPKAKAKQDSREMKRIKSDAQKIIDQHKADEQADIEAGKTETA